MISRRNLNVWLVVLACLAISASPATAATIYVDDSATGANDGSSWADAYNCLQDALAVALSGDQVRVAAGTYKPDQGAAQTPLDRAATFQLNSGVTVKGGFAGAGQPNPDARNVELYETILSGDLAGDDAQVDPVDLLTEPTRAENSYHVVTGHAAAPYTTAVLDGLTISGGNANVPYSEDQYRCRGGGLFNYTQLTNLTVNNCTFRGNSASNSGGGMHIYSWSNPAVTNCTFNGNQAGDGGAGMSISWYCAATISGCTFSDNVVTGAGTWNAGGGLYVSFDMGTTVTNCIFAGNSASYKGGGMYNGNHLQGYPAPNPEVPPTKLINCTFIGNSASTGGGAMYNMQSGPEITNCTFADNSSSAGPGGAMLTFYGGEPPENRLVPLVTNCILWGNTAPQIADTTYWPLPDITIVNYSDVQGGWLGTGNIDLDPLFEDPASGDYRLGGGSPCIDVGDNSAVPADITTDLDGNPRIVNDTVDMGAYEYQVTPVLIDVKPGSYPNAININGNGVIPVAILGSAEFDVTQVVIGSLNFAGLEVRVKPNGVSQCSISDVSGPEGVPDGYDDLVCQFLDDPLLWLPGDGIADLTGMFLLDGVKVAPFKGTDEIRIVP